MTYHGYRSETAVPCWSWVNLSFLEKYVSLFVSDQWSLHHFFIVNLVIQDCFSWLRSFEFSYKLDKLVSCELIGIAYNHYPDNHDSVSTHLKPDILECEVKWALESMTMNKASGGNGIPVELFQILKDDAVKVLQKICQQIWKTQQWPQDWKRRVLIPIPKNAQTTTQLHSSHMLVK